MTAGFDPATAGIVWNSPIYTTGSVKFTSTREPARSTSRAASRPTTSGTTRSTSRASARTPFTPEWYTDDQQERQRRCGTQWNAGATNQGMYPDRFAASASVSYVTGAHNIKVGVQDTWGRYRQFRSANGDIRAVFMNGVRVHGDHPQHAGQLRGRPEGRPRHLRAGLVDDESADGELRRALGVLRVRHPGGDLRRRPVRRDGAHLRSDRHADLEEHRAARRRGVRPVRQPEDRAEVQHRQVRAGRHHRVLEPLQPAGAARRRAWRGPT